MENGNDIADRLKSPTVAQISKEEKLNLMSSIQNEIRNMIIYDDDDPSCRVTIQYRLLNLAECRTKANGMEVERKMYLAHMLEFDEQKLENENIIMCSACALFGIGKSDLRTKGIKVEDYGSTNRKISFHENTKTHIKAINTYLETKLIHGMINVGK